MGVDSLIQVTRGRTHAVKMLMVLEVQSRQASNHILKVDTPHTIVLVLEKVSGNHECHALVSSRLGFIFGKRRHVLKVTSEKNLNGKTSNGSRVCLQWVNLDAFLQ